MLVGSKLVQDGLIRKEGSKGDKAQKAYLLKQKSGKGLALFGNEYNATFFQLFCDSVEEYRLKISPDLWGSQLDTKKFLEEYFKVKL